MRSVKGLSLVIVLAWLGLGWAARGSIGLTTAPGDHGLARLAAPRASQPAAPKGPKIRPEVARKGMPEPPGHSTILSTGGPDTYGYQWIDSNEPGWTPPAYLDPPNPGTLTLGDDDYVEVTLPFDFLFYGTLYGTIYIGSNGFASFGNGYTTFGNGSIPSTSTPNNALYVYWDDMRPPSGGHIDTATYVVNGQRVFVIEWDSIPRYSNYGHYTFEIQLYEAGDSLAFLYEAVTWGTSYDNGASATIGIENADGTDGLQYSYNTASVNDGDAILFHRVPPANDVGVTSIDVPAGSVNLGSTITPQATVENFGTNAATFPVTFEILDASNTVIYTSTRNVLGLAPGDQSQVTFDDWTASTPGTYIARVYTAWSSDESPANDTLARTFQVYRMGTDYLVLDLDPAPSSGSFIHEVLQDLGYSGYYTTDPAALVATNLDSFSTVWVTLGIYSSNYTLSHAQVEELQTYLLGGGRAYVEGGDCWGYDASRTLLDSLFGIDATNTQDGSSDLDSLIGQSNALIPSVTEQDTWVYGGPNSWIDRLAVDPAPPYGGLAQPILYNWKVGYNTGVAYSNSTYNAVALSHEISGDTVGASTRALRHARDLVEWFMDFLMGPTLQVHDLSVVGIVDPSCITLNPSTSYPVRIAVKNTGTFTENSYVVRVQVTDTLGNTYYNWLQNFTNSLNPGETDTVSLSDWMVPADPNLLIMTAWVELTDDAFPTNDTVVQNYYNYHRHGTYACETYGPYHTSGTYFLGDLAYDPTRQVMYVVDVDGVDNGLLVVDADPTSPTYGDSVDYIPAAGWSVSQRGVAYNPVEDHILVGNWSDGTIYIVDASTYALVSSWNISLPISGLAWDDDQGLLWVITNSDPDSLYLVDPYGQTFLKRLRVAWGVDSGAYSGAGLAYLGNGQLLAPNQGARTLEVLRGCTGEAVAYALVEGPFQGAWGVGYVDGTDYAWITDPWGDWQSTQYLYKVWLEIPYAPGDVNGDGRISPEDLANLSRYLMQGGPAPAGNADADLNGLITPDDLEVIANYLFMNGPLPGCP